MSARIKVFLTIVILTIGISLPYILAARSAGEGYVFGGFLVNPLDGNSYLAKMQQGLAGQWEFSLTYSPQGGGGAYIFLFYIFLGHLAGWTGLPLLLVFHLARLLASIGLLVALWRFFRWLAKDDLDLAWKMFLLAAIGSGLGWLAAIFTGYLSGDFWIAETKHANYQRRANAAKNYLASLGIDPSRMNVISYGKERPAELGWKEEAWAKNRRAVTVVIGR